MQRYFKIMKEITYRFIGISNYKIRFLVDTESIQQGTEEIAQWYNVPCASMRIGAHPQTLCKSWIGMAACL